MSSAARVHSKDSVKVVPDTRPSAAARGYGYRWQKRRALFLIKNPLCAACLARGVTRLATTVDHIKPHNGNSELMWDESNWQSLCTADHNRKIAKEKRG